MIKSEAGSCPATNTRKDKLEEAVTRKIREYILTYENLQDLVDIVNDTRESSVDDDQTRFDSVIAELNGVNQRLCFRSKAVWAKTME